MLSDLGALATLVNYYQMDSDTAEEILTRVGKKANRQEEITTPNDYTVIIKCELRTRENPRMPFATWFSITKK